jgi:hypothetical protein
LLPFLYHSVVKTTAEHFTLLKMTSQVKTPTLHNNQSSNHNLFSILTISFCHFSGNFLYPTNIECKKCSSDDIIEFATQAKEIGVQYIGLCCGNSSAYMRDLAEVYDRKPEASRYSCDLSLSFVWGKNKELNKSGNKEFMYQVYGMEK